MISLGKRKSPSIYIEDDEKQPLPVGHFLALIIFFTVAFALRYWFNFLDMNHMNAYGACDASEYLRDADALLRFVQSAPQTFWSEALEVLRGTASASTVHHVQDVLSPLKDFQIAGPIFPAFLAACYAVCLTPFNMMNWQIPLMAQTLLSALTCVLITMTGCRAFGKMAGYVSGIIAAIYPAFIVNSGRLYSETFAAFLLCVILYITTLNFTNPKGTAGASLRTNFVNGIFAACLQLTRSIMVVLSATLLPIILFQQGWRKGLVGLVSFIIGFALVAAPWLMFQKLAFGKVELIVDRVGHYNFFIGNNVDTDGWLSFPYPDGRGIEQKPMQQLAQESIEKSPIRWLHLLQDKPLRLFKFPWNDFRAPMGTIEFASQVAFHQLVLLFAAVGLILSYLVKQRKRGPDTEYERGLPGSSELRAANAAKTFVLFVFLVHCAYMVFITVPRYNLTAMPELILFAGGGLASVLALCQLRRGPVAAAAILISCAFLFTFLHLPMVPVIATIFGGQNAAVGVIFDCILRSLALLSFALGLWLGIGSLTERELGDERKRISHASGARSALILLTVILFPVLVLPAGANGRPFEWTSTLREPNAVVTQSIAIPSDFSQTAGGRQPYILIDSNGLEGLAQTQVEVNGTKVDAPFLPAISLYDEFARYQDLNDSTYTREGEWIFDCMTQAAGIRNTSLRQWFLVPVPSALLKPGTTVNVALRNMSTEPAATIYGSYATSHNSTTIPSVAVCSWEKAFYGVANDHGFSDPRYDIKIRNSAVLPSKKDLSTAPGTQSGRFNIHLLLGPSVPFNTKIKTVERNQPPSPEYQNLLTQQAAPVLISDSKPEYAFSVSTLPAYDANSYWVIRLSGKARRTTGSAKLGVSFRAITADKSKDGNLVSYSSPWGGEVHTGPDWKRIECSFPLEPEALRAPLSRISIGLAVSGATAGNGANIIGQTEVKDLSVRILKLPNNPIHPGHEVL